MTIRGTVLGVILAAAASLSVQAVQQTQDLDARFQSALYKEQVKLKRDAAVAGYKQVAALAGSRKDVAAKALLQMAGCYERLGNPAARPTYEQVLSEYGSAGPVAL